MKLPFWQSIKLTKNDPLNQELEVMSSIPVFENVPSAGLKIIRSLCHVRYYKEDEHIFRKGEPGVGMYIIMEGAVEIYENRDESKTILAELEDGDFFGELALLDDSARAASSRAAGYSRMLGFFRPDLLSLMKRNPRLSTIILHNIARLTGKKLVQTNNMLEEKLEEIEKLEAQLSGGESS